MPYLVFDLEMSGPDPEIHDIIQVGAVLVDNDWNEIAKFESNVCPENINTISVKAEEIHGLSKYDLLDAPAMYEVLENLEEWVKTTLKRSNTKNFHDIVLCGQGVMNDINFLQEAYYRENMKWPFAYKLIDLLSISTFAFMIMKNNGLEVPKRRSLNHIAEFFDLKREGDLHNALEDAELTLACFQKCFDVAKKAKLPTE
ncbi:3'-5' exonuclease [Persicobacter psychrovividus]|uniref:Exonuclease domain-containing protein n=1 Tax=Persicobacter psychrovividus TaxID=387638 RepID=A0ABN6LGD0_9BACT|nr:hypothetical protein PEPS_26670 [Persicobacter psychrovividus]